MIEIYLKYDNMHTNGTLNALICINNYVNSCINCMLSQSMPGFQEETNGYYVAYKLITLSCILFMFIEIKLIHCHSCVMFTMKSMSMCND